MEKYLYPQLYFIQAVTMVIVNQRDSSQRDLTISAGRPAVCRQRHTALSPNAMLSWPLQGAAGGYSLPSTASIKSHLSTFFSSHQYTELRGCNPLPPY